MLSASTSVQDEVAAHFRALASRSDSPFGLGSQAPNTGFSSHFRDDFLSLRDFDASDRRNPVNQPKPEC